MSWQSARLLWHKEQSLGDADAVIIPGGFSYGDYLRTGAIARFSPVMEAVRGFAFNGGTVLGICNGFQILCEAGLLPGALIRNRSLQFRCEHVFLKTVTAASPFTCQIPADTLMRVPIAHGEGCYFADEETFATYVRAMTGRAHFVGRRPSAARKRAPATRMRHGPIGQRTIWVITSTFCCVNDSVRRRCMSRTRA